MFYWKAEKMRDCQDEQEHTKLGITAWELEAVSE